ncbi:MAG: hypothetical protein HDR30_02690 [Lachnospiraceae bacterium]|nr:hypothetical protein [Lachnospiraceae bacterium]
MKKKKNRFLLFCLSFLPGAGEMYLGFMKMGLSLLSLFALIIIITFYSNIGIMGIVSFVICVYGFFHANNLGALSDEEFYQIEDEYLFGLGEKDMNSLKDFFMGKYRKVFAVILILFGVSMLWQTFCRFLRHMVGSDYYNKYISGFMSTISTDVPRMIIAFLIIWFGFNLIRGKKEELDRLEKTEEMQQAEPYRTESMQQTENYQPQDDGNHFGQ